MNYLYNGIELPALPEWDREKYPYAVITETKVLTRVRYTLKLYQKLFVAHDENYSEDNWSLLSYGDYLTATIYPASQTEWSGLELKTVSTIVGTVEVDGEMVPYTSRLCDYASNYIFWSNNSFSGPNGEDWITASDPIPVNPAPTLDPTALLMSWQVGNRIRGGA